MHKHFLSKGPLTSFIYCASYFNLGIEAFFGRLSGDGTEFWAPCDSVAPPIGGYGVRLIRLWLRVFGNRLPLLVVRVKLRLPTSSMFELTMHLSGNNHSNLQVQATLTAMADIIRVCLVHNRLLFLHSR